MYGTTLSPRALAVCLVGLVFASGCAGTQNTLAQDLAWERWQKCKDVQTGVELKEIRPDGQIWILHGTSGELQAVRECLSKAMSEQSRASGVSPARGTVVAAPVTEAIPRTQPVPSIPAAGVVVPLWRVGDEWAYRYSQGGEGGTYVWEIARVESLDGVDHYVIKSGTREIYYRTSDLASSIEKVDGRVVRRDTPSRVHYAWPLAVGKTWEQSYRREQPVDRQTSERASKWTVDVEEQVTVPAGSFRALKITERNRNTGALIYEMWYAPDVKQWVRIREVLSSGLRERELIVYRLK